MASFTRIYFDTNVLIAANWPKLSAALERLLDLAKLFKVSVFLPTPVEQELDAHWSRVYDEKQRKAARSFKDLNNYTGQSEVDSDAMFPKKDAALRTYREAVKTLRENWRIESVPITLRPTEELFRMAVCDQPPFQEGDVGFQDAVIYLSVIDHLVKEPAHIGAFVSQDGIYSDSRVLEYAKTAGATVEVYANVEQVYKELDSRLEVALKRAWDHDRKCAEDALTKQLSELQKFVADNFEISENELGFGGRILAVRNLEVQRVRNVQTPFPLERKENEPVKVSFEIELVATLEVQRSYMPQTPSRLKVGQEAPPPEMKSLREMLAGPMQEEQIWPWLAEAEATARPDDKEYRTIQLLSVRSKGLNAPVIIERALATGLK